MQPDPGALVPANPISTYLTIGIICGGTAGVAQSIVLGGSPLFSLVLASLSGAVAGVIYGYVKLRIAASRNSKRR
jgi:ABC-type uncharacterized transport system permease subunit